MATFAEMQQYVSDRLLDPNQTAVSSAKVKAALNDALRYWKIRRFWFNTATEDLTLTQGDPLIPLPDDFLVELPMNDGFVIAYGGQRWPLIKKNPREYDNVYLTDGNGLPTIYTVKAGDYFCYYIPDQNYTIRVYYLKQYEDMVSDGDESDFTVYAARLLELWTLANLSAELRQDDKMESYYRAAALDEWKNLGVFNAKVNSPGHLSLHSYLM
jgi:hypothetical protein